MVLGQVQTGVYQLSYGDQQSCTNRFKVLH